MINVVVCVLSASSTSKYYLIFTMQLPEDITHTRNNHCVFEQLLQQYSISDFDREDCPQRGETGMDGQVEHQRTQPDLWFKLDEVPHQHVIEEEENCEKEDEVVEFSRLRSLREEQENKIASFMREDRLMKAVMHGLNKNSSPVGKGWQSLSPRKTKKIEKNRWMARSTTNITDVLE